MLQLWMACNTLYAFEEILFFPDLSVFDGNTATETSWQTMNKYR